MKRLPIAILLLAAGLSVAGAPVAPPRDSAGGSPSGTLSADTLLRRISALRTDLAKASSRAFDSLDIDNQRKAAGFIAELLNRSEQLLLGTLPPGRYEWSWSGFDDPAQMTRWAEGYLAELAAGRDPFPGKFAEPGVHVIDHALIEKNGEHHLFYIRGTAATSWSEFPTANFGHAVSTDLKNWRIENPVLQTEPGAWDGYQVWAPYVMEHGGKYYMFYTGVNDSVSQAIGLAVSDDLYRWKRCGDGPVVTPGVWGQWSENAWSDCRDPVVLQDGDTFYCYYTARRKEPSEACIGVASSKDLTHWRDEGFIRFENSLDTPPESPYAFKRDGRYYLVYTSYRDGTVYSVSDDPVRGWKQIPGDEASLISGVSASEVYRTSDGDWYLSLISHPNGLHFFEIRSLVWNGGEKPVVRPMDAE